MPNTGIKRARKQWLNRKSVSHSAHVNASEISSRGIALNDADLAMVIGGTEERSDARAQVEVGAAQPLSCCCDGMQTEVPAYLYGKRIFQ